MYINIAMSPVFLHQFVFAKRYHAARQLLFWVVAALAIIFLHGVSENDFSISAISTLFIMPVHIFFTYGLLLWLVPGYLVTAKYGRFCLYFFAWLLCWQLVSVIVTHFVLIPFITGVPGTALDFNVFEYFDWFKSVVGYAIAAAAVLIKMFKYWYNEQLQKQQAEKEKINAELQLLKAQLHPHFLFNTLNNLYSLVYEKSDKAPKMLLRLSGLLSYILYECKADEVLLSKEISTIKNYVALEQERYGERLDVSLSFSGDIDDRMIVPMLFQPFIENAFKHGTSEQLGKAWMSIDLSVKKNQLIFKLINSCEKNETSSSSGGIGIHNVKKRLELLYPAKHTLQYGMEEGLYVVSLFIEFGTLMPEKYLQKNQVVLLK